MSRARRADFVGARSYCEQSLAAFRQLRDGWGIASTLSDLAGLSCDQGNDAEARRLYGESIKMFQEVGSQTRHCPGPGMSGRERRGAIECRTIVCTWLEPPLPFVSDWALRSRPQSNRDWRRHWNSRAERWGVRQV